MRDWDARCKQDANSNMVVLLEGPLQKPRLMVNAAS